MVLVVWEVTLEDLRLVLAHSAAVRDQDLEWEAASARMVLVVWEVTLEDLRLVLAHSVAVRDQDLEWEVVLARLYLLHQATWGLSFSSSSYQDFVGELKSESELQVAGNWYDSSNKVEYSSYSSDSNRQQIIGLDSSSFQQESSWFDNSKGDNSLMMERTDNNGGSQSLNSDGSSPRYFEPNQPDMGQSQSMYSSYSTMDTNNGQQTSNFGASSSFEQAQSWFDNAKGDNSLMMEPTEQSTEQSINYDDQLESSTSYMEPSSGWVGDTNPHSQTPGFSSGSDLDSTPNWFD